jgi:hypothetical protein
MADVVRVRFLEGATPYQKGEVAGFDKAHAAQLVEAGRAVYCDGTKAAEPEAAEDKPKPKPRRRRASSK